MSIPLDARMRLASAVPLVNRTGPVDEVRPAPDNGAAGTFSRILEDLMTNSTAVPKNVQSSAKPLTREKILELIQWANLMMSEHLLQSVGGGFDVNARWKIDSLLQSPFGRNPENTNRQESDDMTTLPPGDAGAKPEIEYLPPSSGTSLSGNRYEELIHKAATACDVDPELIRGVIQVESNFNPSARSPKGAMGLMQLMPATARDLGVDNPYDPEQNIMGGTRYLKKLLERYDGNIPLALAAYNWGMGNLENHRDRMPEETRNYVSRITSLYKENKGNAT